MNITTFAAILLVGAGIMVSGAATGCSHDDDDHDAGATSSGGHTSPYPACNAITQACHEVDVGEETPIHACHDNAHAAKSDADCTPIKDNCLAICAAAKVDAGAKDGG